MLAMDLGDNECRFVNYNKYVTHIGDFGTGRGYGCVEARDMRELFIPSVEFFCDLKNLKVLKNRVYNKYIQGPYKQETIRRYIYMKTCICF